jgi:hypothetical protein
MSSRSQPKTASLHTRHHWWLQLLLLVGGGVIGLVPTAIALGVLVYMTFGTLGWLPITWLVLFWFSTAYPVYRTLRWASRKLHLGQTDARSFSALNLVWTLCLASALTIPIAFAVQQNYRAGGRNARVAHAKSDVQTLAFAIKRYEAQMAVLPSRLDDLILPATNPRGERVGPFLERLPEPPRGYSAYRYERRGTNGFSISTAGDREVIEDRR